MNVVDVKMAADDKIVFISEISDLDVFGRMAQLNGSNHLTECESSFFDTIVLNHTPQPSLYGEFSSRGNYFALIDWGVSIFRSDDLVELFRVDERGEITSRNRMDPPEYVSSSSFSWSNALFCSDDRVLVVKAPSGALFVVDIDQRELVSAIHGVGEDISLLGISPGNTQVLINRRGVGIDSIVL
jgi:hypothetical protein